MNQQRRKGAVYTIISLVLLAIFFVILFMSLSSKSQKISYTDFKENIGNYVKIDNNIYHVSCVDAAGKKYYFNVEVGYTEKVAEFIHTAMYNRSLIEKGGSVANDAPVANAALDYTAADPNQASWLDYVLPVLWVCLIIGLGVIMFRSIAKQNNQNMDFGRSRAKAQKNIKVRFADVAGADEEKEELQEIIDFLKNPQKYNDVGARIPHGVLLVGPPGTGKTLFAKAVAGEAGVPFFSISGSDFVEMFVGVGASRVRDLFDQAKKNMPCIIFIDEIDAVGRQRGAGLGGGHDEKEQTLNQLLVEMDGFESNTNIIVMAATNRADILDPALVRPGRFDRQIFVNRPDVRGREAILKVHARKKPIGPDVNFRQVARITAGFTGADLENLLNEAAILAVRDGRKVISMEDVNEGINKVVMGPAKKSRLVTEPDKRITAYHEAGHAILGSLLKYCDPIHEVTIIPRGQAAGYTMSRPDNDNDHVSKQQLLDEITMGLGGRVAEELIIKDISSGASSDIKVATERARKMVTEWGMSDRIGPVNYGDNDQVFIGRDYETKAGYSEHTAAAIDEEIGSIIKEAHQKAVDLLTENKKLLDNMARLLIERETIYQDEVDLIMQGKDINEILEYMDKRDKERAENPFRRAEEFANEKAKSNAPTDNAANATDKNDAIPEMPTANTDNQNDKDNK